ncbi:MAG TPA: hypothetical protein VNY75_10705 [Rhizomicrobium sp.]|nr:hypothetical protein [Rhizomicrobium sp.]
MNMLQVIQKGAAEALQHSRTLPCPFCGEPPPLAARIAGKFVVACENEDCAANPQVCAPTLDQAWARWNIRRAA